MVDIPLKFYSDNKRHLVCLPYSIENLHSMANILSINKCWFHKNHYDIPKTRINEIKDKTINVSTREILQIINFTHMKSYETIPYYNLKKYQPEIIAFDKLDGSNLRFEFSFKSGFYKFGTRKTLINHDSEPFGFAIKLFLEKYEKDLIEVFNSKYRNNISFVCFAELISEGRFGQHDFSNKTNFDIVLIDISIYKKGLISPQEFINNFGHLHIPQIIYKGILTQDFVDAVEQNKLLLKEGVICKGLITTKKTDTLYYCKIKTNEWLESLKIFNKNLYDDESKQFNIQ
jgi:hypothetical protein